MLIPVYVVGFIWLALFIWAVAGRLPVAPPTRAILRTCGIVAGPVFFIVVFAFSGWIRHKTYDMQWTIGKNPYDSGLSASQSGEPLVTIYRTSPNATCFEEFYSSRLAKYLTSQRDSTVAVRYAVTYDFFQPRGSNVEAIGAFVVSDENHSYLGEFRGGGSFECFPW